MSLNNNQMDDRFVSIRPDVRSWRMNVRICRNVEMDESSRSFLIYSDARKKARVHGDFKKMNCLFSVYSNINRHSESVRSDKILLGFCRMNRASVPTGDYKRKVAHCSKCLNSIEQLVGNLSPRRIAFAALTAKLCSCKISVR